MEKLPIWLQAVALFIVVAAIMGMGYYAIMAGP